MKISPFAGLSLILSYLVFGLFISQEVEARSGPVSASWTVFIVMEADEELNHAALKNLEEMKAAYLKSSKSETSNVKMNLLIQFKDFSRNETVSSERTDLYEFLKKGIRQFPARHYLLVFWGHGMGWDSKRRAAANSLIQIRNEFLDGRRFDIILSDACLIQTVEVDSEFSSSARYVVGSAQIMPYTGISYGKLFSDLSSKEMTVPEVARQLADVSLFENRENTNPDLLTMAAVTSREIEKKLIPSMARLGVALSRYIVSDNVKAILLTQVIRNSPGYWGGYKDLGLFLSLLQKAVISQNYKDQNQLKKRERLLNSIEMVREALEGSILRATYGRHYQEVEHLVGVSGFSGISVWLPETIAEFRAGRESLRNSHFYQINPFWELWMDELFFP